MQNNKLILFLIFFLISFSLQIKAQDPFFSQLFSNPMLTNPAFAGNENTRAALGYKHQYIGSPTNYQKYGASYDQRLHSSPHGLGLSLNQDIIGSSQTLTTTEFAVSYAYESKFNNRYILRYGLQAGIMQKSLFWDGLLWGSDIAPFVGDTNLNHFSRFDMSISFLNLGTGAVFYSNKFYAGFSIHNLTNPYQTFTDNRSPETRLGRRYSFYSGYRINLTDSSRIKLSLTPNAYYIFQNKENIFQVGLNIWVNSIYGGVGYKQEPIPNSNAIIYNIGCKILNMRINYSMDWFVSKLRSGEKSTQEVSISYTFKMKRQSELAVRFPGN
jgi:type IX secretion system PorP/SprF family membrane protein